MFRSFESSYLAIELTSSKNAAFISDALEHLKYLEENEVNTWKNSETSWYYLNQLPVGGERPFPVLSLRIPTTQLAATLIGHAFAYQKVEDHVEDQQMDDYRFEIHQASCYWNASYALFFTSMDQVVKHIWLVMNEDTSAESDRRAIADVLHYLGEKYALLLVDWYKPAVVDLSNKATLERYLLDDASNKGKD
jgi:hypothetical protein